MKWIKTINKILTTIRKKWVDYPLETFVIILAILIAFMLNNWNEVRKNEKIELGHIRNLSKNLATNIEMINEDLASYNIGIQANDVVLGAIYLSLFT